MTKIFDFTILEVAIFEKLSDKILDWIDFLSGIQCPKIRLFFRIMCYIGGVESCKIHTLNFKLWVEYMRKNQMF